MLIIPTIYIRNREAVEIENRGAIFNKDALEMAKELVSAGTEVLYIVDLDAPATGHVPNIPIIESIIKKTGLRTHVTGNIRSAGVVESYIKAGAEHIILGTLAYQKPDFLKSVCSKFPKKIGVHIEVRGGKVVIRGWTVAAKKTALDYARQFHDAGVGIFFYSDVVNEGTITHEDIKNISGFVNNSPVPVVHSTDLNNINELELILKIQSFRLMGTILDKSMYSGKLDIRSVITHAKEETPTGMDEPTLIP